MEPEIGRNVLRGIGHMATEAWLVQNWIGAVSWLEILQSHSVQVQRSPVMGLQSQVIVQGHRHPMESSLLLGRSVLCSTEAFYWLDEERRLCRQQSDFPSVHCFKEQCLPHTSQEMACKKTWTKFQGIMASQVDIWDYQSQTDPLAWYTSLLQELSLASSYWKDGETWDDWIRNFIFLSDIYFFFLRKIL